MNPNQIKTDILFLEEYIKDIDRILKHYELSDELFDSLTTAKDILSKLVEEDIEELI